MYIYRQGWVVRICVYEPEKLQLYMMLNINFQQKHLDLTPSPLDTLGLRQNGWRFAEDIFESFILSDNFCILNQILGKLLDMVPINKKKTALVQVMAWRRTGDKPLSEPKWHNLLSHTHIYIYIYKSINMMLDNRLSRPWDCVNTLRPRQNYLIFQMTFSNAFSCMKRHKCHVD